MKVRKSTALILAVAMGLGSLIVVVAGADGDGALSDCCCCCGCQCCFFAAVRFLVDDSMSGDKNSWGHLKTRGDTIRSDSGLRLELERLGAR